jgi:hypothetical protein
MVTIKYLTHEGDTAQQLELEEARTQIAQEIDKGNIVFDEAEKKLIQKATLGKIKDDSVAVVLPRIAGG